MRFRVMRFRAPPVAPSAAPPVAPPGGGLAGGAVPVAPSVPAFQPLLSPLACGEQGIGHPSVESQLAGLNHLIRIAREQAAVRRRAPAGRAGTDPAAGAGRPCTEAELPGAGRDGAPEAYRHS